MKNPQLNLLAHLAKADGKIDVREAKFLIEIGQEIGVPEEEVRKILDKPEPVKDISNLTPYQKFECICHLVQLMKADKNIADPEILFCRKMAINLGYDTEVIRALFTRLDENPELRTKPDSLYNMVNDFRA